MKALMHKEYIINKALFIWSPLFLIVIGPFLSSFQNISLAGAVYVSMNLTFQIFNTERYVFRSEIMINSLPTSRSQIVLAKYLMITFIFFVIAGLLNWLIPIFEITSIEELLLSFFAVMIFIAIYVPVFYLFGPRFVMLSIFVLAFLTSSLFIPLIQTMLTSTSSILFYLIIITIIVLIVSILLSIKIYQSKDF